MKRCSADVLKRCVFVSRLDEAKKWRAQDRDTINKLNQQLSELEAEIRMLRRSNDSLDTERQRDKQTIARLNEELDKLRIVSSAYLALRSFHFFGVLSPSQLVSHNEIPGKRSLHSKKFQLKKIINKNN